jgi:hypothetical protein
MRFNAIDEIQEVPNDVGKILAAELIWHLWRD